MILPAGFPPKRRAAALPLLAAVLLCSAPRGRPQGLPSCPPGLPPQPHAQLLADALPSAAGAPEAGSIHVALGLLAQEEGDARRALSEFADASVASSPLREYALHGQATALEACGQSAEAQPVWEELFRWPGEPTFRTEAAGKLADAAEAAGRKADAAQYVEALRQASPDDPAVAARLAGLYEDSDRKELAAPLVRWLWVFRPSDPASTAFLAARPGWLDHLRGLPSYLQVTRLRNLADAGDFRTLAADLPKVTPGSPEEASWLGYLRGRLAESRRDYPAALASYRSIQGPPLVLWAATERLGRLLPSGVIPAKQAAAVEESVMGLPRTFAGRQRTLLFLMRWRERQKREDRSIPLALALFAGKRSQPDAAALLYRKAWDRWLAGKPRDATALWTSLAQALPPGADARSASLYTMMRLGLLKPQEAASAKAEILAEDRYGYFGYRLRPAAAEGPAPPPPPPPLPVAVPGTHLEKASILLTLGFPGEAAGELRLALGAGDDPAVAFALARAQQLAGDYAGGVRTARAAFPDVYGQAGDRLSPQVWRTLYPAPFVEALAPSAKEAGVPVLLACSVIRQESLWDPAAVSRSGALGLMQLLPATGRWVASRRGMTAPPGEPFFDPAYNTRVGCTYLRESLDRNGGALHLALAAYNAGQSRVNDWVARPRCPRDPALFIESIPFYETRSYVRRILLNLWEYKRLYPDLNEPGDGRYLRSAGFDVR